MEVERRSGRGISRAMASDPARSNGAYETLEPTRHVQRVQKAEPCVRLLGGEELPDLQELLDKMPARVFCPQTPVDVIHAAEVQRLWRHNI
ncbi:hypothetical protein EYF80_027331 [Liparis tanakae]|uniref:Uncharacterized protein n=1 Tax=Liparis tanakae TaxID=230148 RepID=A0A4Z2HBP2_9TELE|nr:hypothetical protein EYF80_027331 [Liparis tanakae]